MSAKVFQIRKQANKDSAKLPLQIHNKIDQAFDRIKQNPLSGVKLHGELGNYYKYRVGDYRIIYIFDIKESKVEIIKIEHRQGVYR